MIFETTISGKDQSGKTTQLLALYRASERKGEIPVVLLHNAITAEHYRKTYDVRVESTSMIERMRIPAGCSAVFIEEIDYHHKDLMKILRKRLQTYLVASITSTRTLRRRPR